mmetsp:Transcript_21211/g.38516  ORF Transcript_21211/g.38516 Transcript_21211/m.38516 type:complete len:96 (-) Transcript_21211:1050-1337(-)
MMQPSISKRTVNATIMYYTSNAMRLSGVFIDCMVRMQRGMLNTSCPNSVQETFVSVSWCEHAIHSRECPRMRMHAQGESHDNQRSQFNLESLGIG